MARRGLPAAFATITKILSPGMRRAALDPNDREFQSKVVFGDYYGALASAGMMSGARARPWPIERAIFDGYEKIIWVYRSVEVIAGQASRLKFELHQGDDVVDDHPLYQLLNVRANEIETGRQFRSRLGKQILLSKKGAFVEVTKARNGTPLRLDLLPPGRTTPVPGSAMAPDVDGIKQQRLIDHYEVVRADGTRSFIPAESVIWFREPHPTDPYSGVTPLEAAGMSAELDFFARLYNTTFMRNDARPGGIVGVGGDMDDDDIKRLEEKFAQGPAEAGKLTVIAGDVSYVDSVTRPRDAQHGETADRSKVEVLDAFGVPESMLGNASGKTFDNAGQEGYNFWLITMDPFLDLQVTGFDELSEPELEGFFDVSHVPALAAAEAAKREEARAEFAAGLIHIDEYREATGKEPFNIPATRALIIANGTTMVPTTKDDQKALGGDLVALGAGIAKPGDLAAGAAPAQAAVNGSAAHPLPGHRDTGPAALGAADSAQPDNSQPDNPGPAASAEAKSAAPVRPSPLPRPRPPLPVPAPRPPTTVRAITGMQVKAAPRQPQTAPQPGGDQQDDDDSDRDAADKQAEKLEAALAAALAVVAAGWAASETAPDPLKWSRDASAAVAPLLSAAALEAASRAARAVGGPRQDDSGTNPSAAFALAAAGYPADGEAPGTPEATAARTSTANVTGMVGTAASGLANRLALAVAAGELVDVAHEASVWARGVAVQAATALVNGAADAAAVIAAALSGRPLVRVWRTRRDVRVRETHRLAEGQRQAPGSPFIVGGWPLMYPGDPAGPLELTAGCRCRLSHRVGHVPATA